MPRFVFEMDSNGDFDIYDTDQSGTGRMNAIGWVDKYRKDLFERHLNTALMTDASIIIAAHDRFYGAVTPTAGEGGYAP